jgi:hypothetical protein
MTSVLPDFDIIAHLHEFGRLKGIPMKRILKNLTVCLLVSAFVILPSIGTAADFELFWDPNCNADADLEGYFIYYKQDASVVADPGRAIDLYVALTDIDFDKDNPSLLIADLLDDVRYCFAVTAWYGDKESGMSNEVCGINGAYAPDPDPGPSINPDPDLDADPTPDLDADPTPDSNPGLNPDSGGASSGGGSSGGCFIGSLR